MSNVILKGNSSGTGTVTLETPDTNSDRTIGLPDADGTMVYADTSGTVVSGLDRLFLGCFTNSGLQLNDRIKSAALWKTRLGNSELAQLTSI
jgi:hypothetical protein